LGFLLLFWTISFFLPFLLSSKYVRERRRREDTQLVHALKQLPFKPLFHDFPVDNLMDAHSGHLHVLTRGSETKKGSLRSATKGKQVATFSPAGI
jgi:hypothetical protein